MSKEKRSVRYKSLLALMMALVLLVSSVPTYTFAAADTYHPLKVSGFNTDVVADTTNMYTLMSQGCLEGGHCYYSSAVRSQGAYPSGSTITTSSGKKYTLRQSTENNSLQLRSGNQTGTLTLETPDIYSKIAVLVTGGGGQAQAKATVIYTDGTESASTTITAYDWYSHHSSEVYGSLYRMRINISGYGRGSIDSGSYSGMYEGIISGLDTDKEVKAVRFNWASGSSSAYFNAFAISGVIGADEHIHDKLSFKQWTLTNSLPTEAGNYVLASDVTISSTWQVPSGKTNLCLNGHGIKMTGSSTAINVGAESEFNLYECNTNAAHKFSVNSSTLLATLDEANGSVTVNGGYITGGNTSGSGGSLVVGGTFNMYGGNLIGNRGANGGAICTQANSTVHIYGGSICYNYTGGGGGAIFCGRPAELYVSGGSIHHNKADAWGGAIYMPEGATCVVDVSGGSFTDNITAKNGGAIHVSKAATLKLSGNPYIADNKTTGNTVNNVNFAAGAFATIENSLDSTASIGVKSSSATAVITSGFDGKGSVSNFVSDNASYDVYQNSDGEVLIGVFNHNHDGIAFEKWESTDSLPAKAGNYVLINNVTISSVWNVPTGGVVNLCLNGKGIIRTNASDTTGSVINVGSGATLNLYDCATATRYYRVTDPSANGAGLGTIISKAAYDNLSDKERGTFTGGYITGGNITGNADNQHLIGGGVNVDGGSFTMNGGTIFGNKVCINAGAVKVKGAGASFIMNGGALLANYNDCYGGAISVGDNNASRLCTVNINGGTIARNWSGRNAGALHVDGYGHTVNITGGNIVNNYTNGNYESAGRGGGAIMKDGANFSLSGNVVIKDNMRSGGIEDNLVFRNSKDNISLSSHLGDDAEVGVYTKLLTATTDHKVATDAQKDDLKHIHYDIPSEGTVVFCDGTKDWVYANGNMIPISGTHHTHTANTLWASAIVPTASVEKDGDEIVYTSLGDAVNNWTDGSTLKLLKDAELTSNPGFFNDAGEWTLDLNGKTLKVKGTSFISASGEEGSEKGQGAIINIDDTSTDGNGKIDGNNNITDENLLYVNNGGTLNLKKGTITNFNQSWGTILVKDNGTVNMYDGFTISGNKSNTNGGGGAVSVSANGTLNMYGGVIENNTATGYKGGGIKITGDTSVVNIYGGTIQNNSATTGGGIAFTGGTLNIKGKANISGNTGSNVYVANGKTINIVGALDDETSIGITIENGSGKFTNGLDGKGAASNFTADASGNEIRIVNKEGYCGPPHSHSWIYTADGDTITAVCSGVEAGSCDIETQTIKIVASGKVYDGTAVTATLTKSDGWTAANGLSVVPDIAYSGNTDAGTYTASITLGEVTASAEFTIDEASMADEVSAEGYTGDYNGEAHGITVTKPDGATVKFGTESGSYTLDASPTYTNAGTYTVYYQVTKKNYITVTGSATVKINKINAVVTIVGNKSTDCFDKTEHTVSGYTATANTSLYDVSKDFTFSGDASVSLTDAGTSYMGLAAGQFVNKNNNFATVTFDVTDGYQTIIPVDAVITTAPETASPIYNGSKLALVKAGKVDGGELLYALGSDPKTAPDESGFKASIPTAKETGSYYVWYRVAADKNHIDLAPECIKVVLAKEDWVTLSGVLYQKDGVTPIEDATITLMKGKTKVDYEITTTNGEYQFIVPKGVYNIVANYNGKSETTSVELYNTKSQDVSMLGGNTESIVNVNSENEGFDVVVGGLNDEARAIRIADGLTDEQNLSLKMTVEAKTVETAKNSKAFTDLSVNTTFMFFDVQLEKSVDSKVTVMKTSTNVLEIAVPYEKINRKDLAAYFCDGSKVKKLTESGSRANGTFRIDKENGFIYIYSTSFSTFAIGYTPYYTLENEVTLGSFKGNVDISLVGLGGEGAYKLENVSLDNIAFANIPKGRYKMTVTWTDGATNTLTMPITVS